MDLYIFVRGFRRAYKRGGGGGGELISEEAKKYFETNYSSADLKTFCI